MNNPVGVFDSGVGGLTVAREIMRQLPGEDMVYFGDTARVPYGSKSKQTVLKYSKQIVRFLKTKNVKAIVVACNTASALALDEIAAELFGTDNLQRTLTVQGNHQENPDHYVKMKNWNLWFFICD